MNIKAISATAVLALAAASYMTPASALPVLCQDPNLNHMLVDSAYVSSCIDAGIGNIGNGINDDFLNAGNTGWTDITAQALPLGFSQLGSSGTFFFNSALWNTFGSIAIGFKFGTGNQPDEWFVYELNSLVSSGTWTFVNVFGTGGGLSHITLYGGEGTTVPEPGVLTLLGLGLLSLGVARRRKEKA